ncbi:MAG TPA: 4-alpha-glucanotransferase [Streptosporangiaceae bacterium]|nr:4-alpha-glucanotransferase [Streptosporangiaceae bacterium]
MSGDRLRREAQAHGVATSYRDWHGRRVEVAEATLQVVLAALTGTPGEPPGPVPAARRPPSGPRAAPRTTPFVSPPAPVAPAAPGRCWGFTVQLYSLRSRHCWGHGDLHDLADLASWSGRELGADFVLINPLHAAEPVLPVSPSPYLPMSRRFTSPLYLRIEDIPEYARLPATSRQRIEELAAPLRAASTSGTLIDRDAVWRGKLTALELIYACPLPAGRRAGFEKFLVAGGEPLAAWAAWCALAESHGPDWRAWPAAVRSGGGEGPAGGGRFRGRARFHAWLQWLADAQRAAAQAAARAAGMRIGVVTDLAVGAHPGGADAWANAGVLVPAMSAGAPPDEFNQRGQDWGQPPWHPGRLAAAGYRPLSGLIRAAFRHAGGLRADHALGLFRLWWVPAGMTPDQGTYVRYPHEAMTGVLTGEAARAGALAIGEDLGTVEDWVRGYLAARGVLGTSMLWFERGRDGLPLPPGQWRRRCLATVGTHDVPPVAAFAAGEQVTLRARLGLLTQDLAAERAAAATALDAWRAALASQGLAPPGGPLDPATFTVALYAYLARTPAVLVGVSLADAVGERRPQNMPGTTTEYPNWQIPLADGDGRPVLLEDLAAHPGVRAVAAAVSLPGGRVPGSAAPAPPRPGPR